MSGSPLRGVTVEVRATDRVIEDVRTDDEGRFTVDSIERGEYQIEAIRPGYVPLITRLSAPAGPVPLTMLPLGTVAGTLVDWQGRSVSGLLAGSGPQIGGGADVALLSGDESGQPSRILRGPTPVGMDGSFSFTGLPPGNYVLAAYYSSQPNGLGSGAALYPNSARPGVLSVASGEVYDRIEFVLHPGTGLHRVAGAVQLGGSSARFAVSLVSTANPSVPIAVTVTAGDGTFRFDGIPDGTYSVLAAASSGFFLGWPNPAAPSESRAYGRSDITVTGDVDRVLVTLHETQIVSAILQATPPLQTADCPPSATAELWPLEAWPVKLAGKATISFTRAVDFGALPAGRYGVSVAGLGKQCFAEVGPPVEVGPGQNAQMVVVRVNRAGQVRGALRDKTLAVSANVILVPTDTDVPVQVRIPDSTGHLAFTDLAPGHYRIAAQPTGSGTLAHASRLVEVRAGSTVDVQLDISGATQ